MATFQMEIKQEAQQATPSEAGDSGGVTAGLMEAIQDSIFKAIESMELAANSPPNHYVTVVKNEPVAFKNELTGYISLDSVPPAVSEPSFINLIPTPVSEEPPSSESYSYEILTPVQIYWPDQQTDNQNLSSMVQAQSFAEPTLTYILCNSDSSSQMEPQQQHQPELVEENSEQPAVAQFVPTEESSMESIPSAGKEKSTQLTHPPTASATTVSPSTNGTAGSTPGKMEKVHKCEICSKTFSQAYRLRTHISTVHLGTKPFRCDICSRAFARKSYLIQHGQVHAESKRYQCDLCNTAYARLADYKKHCKKPSHTEKLEKGTIKKSDDDENDSSSAVVVKIEGAFELPDSNSVD